MYAAASGMAAQQTNLEVIADNLANADVAGFKQVAASFIDVNAGGTLGLGTASSGKHPIFSQGKLEHSGGPFDVAIDGNGFFRVERAGTHAYTRNGEFSRAADGSLRNADGWALRDLRIPADARSVHVAADGRVTIDGDAGPNRSIGRLRLATFAAPEALRPLGGTVFAATYESGPEHRIDPGQGGPTIAFGMLERSNVSIVESMMQILTAQRAYEANAKGVQAADEMQRIANNLNRG
ncbi:MAG TPA: flagellar hook-basal body protein [Candidatus Lustribacter sp.]|jgi:flagellar basal-body rod protein FlgG|nr:flagellar hook-basal body protein [Candidatus Lustribacter sp.]